MMNQLTLADVEAVATELREALNEIQQPRSDFALINFVVGEKDTMIAQYAQCVLEMQIKYDTIRQSRLDLEIMELEAQELETSSDKIDQLKGAKKRIDIESTERAMLGALREFACLVRIWESFPTRYSYSDIQGDQQQYWLLRLARQADQDIAATGRIGVGNQDALRQAKIGVTEGENGRAVYTICAPNDQRRISSAVRPD